MNWPVDKREVCSLTQRVQDHPALDVSWQWYICPTLYSTLLHLPPSVSRSIIIHGILALNSANTYISELIL